MERSAILDQYRAFLLSHGAKDCHGFCPACPEKSRCDVLPSPPELLDIMTRSHHGCVSDQEVVAAHSSMGAHRSISFLHMKSKVEDLETMLPSFTAPDIESGIDFGGNVGFLSIFLALTNIMNWPLACLDGNSELIAYGRQMASDYGVKIDYLCAMADQTGLPDASYDLVTSIALIDCCVSKWRAIVREMLRVARKRVVIYYGLNTEFPYIDPLEVLAVMSQSAIIDPPAYLYTKGGKKDVAILTAHKPGYEPQTTDRIMLVKA